jgi:hypothetical protein
VKIEIVETVTGPRLAQAWQLYAAAFDELRYLAVQRHVLHREEFDALLADRRVGKHLALAAGGGKLCGLSTYTNDLTAVPLISPDYFQRRWPDLHAARRIWYCGFVAVAPGAGNSGAFAALIKSMYRLTEADAGIVAIDFCRFNEETRRMSRTIPLLLHRFSGNVRSTRLDQQSYWVYEFPRSASTPHGAGGSRGP